MSSAKRKTSNSSEPVALKFLSPDSTLTELMKPFNAKVALMDS